MREESGQMAVELAALMPAAIVAALVVWNLARFVCAVAVFDRAAKDVVLAQGVSVSGEDAAFSATHEAEAALRETLASFGSCSVTVAAAPETDGAGIAGPAIRRFRCTLRYRPWPRSIVVAGVDAKTPFELVHETEVAADVGRMGAIDVCDL